MSRYLAFISYKHATSQGFASRFELALKRYGRPIWQIPPAIFRDEKILKAGESISEGISKALSSSEFLIYLASPEAAKSVWVLDELKQWCDNSERASRLIIVRTAGQILFDKQGCLDWSASDALPTELEGMLISDPLVIDLSWADTPERQSLFDPDYRTAINQIAATLRGITPEQMWDTALREQQKASRLRNAAIIAISALAIGLGVAAWIAWQQKLTADENRDIAEAGRIAANSQLLIANSTGNLRNAVSKARQSLDLSPSVSGNTALRLSLSKLPQTVAVHDFPENSNAQAFSSDPKKRFWAIRKRGKESEKILTLLSSKDLSVVQSFKHEDRVTAIHFSPDGCCLASATSKYIRIWRLKGFNLIHKLPLEAPVHALALENEAHGIILGGLFRGIVRLDLKGDSEPLALIPEEEFDLKRAKMVNWNGDFVYRMPQAGTFGGIHFSEDNQYLVAFGGNSMERDPNAYVWKVGSDKPLIRVDHIDPLGGPPGGYSRPSIVTEGNQNFIKDARLSPSGEILATAGFDGSIRLWSMKEQSVMQVLWHQGHVNRIRFSKDGSKLLSGSVDETMRIWDVASGREILRVQHNASISQVAFDKTETSMFSASHDATIRRWSVHDGTEQLRIPMSDVVLGFDLTDDAENLFAIDQRGPAKLWNLSAQSQIGYTQNNSKRLSSAPEAGRYAAIENLRHVVVRKVSDGKEIARFSNHTEVRQVSLGANGQRLAILSKNDQDDLLLKVWEVGHATPLITVSGESIQGRAINLSAGGRWLAAHNNDNDNVQHGTRIWSVDNPGQSYRLAHQGRSLKLAFSPNQELLAAGTVSPGSAIHLIDPQGKNKAISLPQEGSVYSLSWGQSQNLLAAGDDKGVSVWKLPQRELIRIPTDSPVRALAVNEQTKRLAIGLEAGNVQIWNYSKREKLMTLTNTQPTPTLSLTADGNYLVTGSEDQIIRIWQLDNKSEIARFNLGQTPYFVGFDDTGERVLAQGWDGRFQVWLWRNESLLKEASKRLP